MSEREPDSSRKTGQPAGGSASPTQGSAGSGSSPPRGGKGPKGFTFKPAPSTGPAGLTYAPPYDPSQEIDPSKAPVVREPEPFRREDFEYFRQQMERKAFIGRVVLLVVVLALLGLNLYLTHRTAADLVENFNADRLHQSELDDFIRQHMVQLEQRLARIEAQQARILQASGAEGGRAGAAAAGEGAAPAGEPSPAGD